MRGFLRAREKGFWEGAGLRLLMLGLSGWGSGFGGLSGMRAVRLDVLVGKRQDG